MEKQKVIEANARGRKEEYLRVAREVGMNEHTAYCIVSQTNSNRKKLKKYSDMDKQRIIDADARGGKEE